MIYANNGPKIFFTSDTHFSQERTLKLSCRPFETVNDMNNHIITEWNNTVSSNDIVYHLGDFGDASICEKLNGRIVLVLGNYEYNPDKNMLTTEYSVEGISELTKAETQLTDDPDYNSDRLYEYREFMKESFNFRDVIFPETLSKDASCTNRSHLKAIKYVVSLNNSPLNGLYMAHVPSEIQKVSNNDDFTFGLFGHIHKLQMVRRYGLNVGIDCHNFKPVSLDQVLFYMNAIQNHYDSEVFGG